MSELETIRPQRRLNLFDSTCIIVGIIIGVGVFETTPLVAKSVSGPGMLILVWVAGGLISLVGALCYAELVTAYPRDGGDYVFITKAFGRPLGFLFAWTQFWIVAPGSLGAMAFVFARYADTAVQSFGGPKDLQVVYALTAVAVLTVVNILGVTLGKWTQNILTTAKVLGLLAVFAVAFIAPPLKSAAPAPLEPGWGVQLAMIFVLFTYGGWNEMAYVGAEVRNPERNVVRALVLGTGSVMLIYVLVNTAFLYALGFAGLRNASAVAVQAVSGLSGSGPAIALLVCLSALGAINGQIFTSSRVYYAFGRDHAMFRPLGRWSPRWGTPVVSLIAQAAVTMALVTFFGTTLWDRVLATIAGAPLNEQADATSRGFQRLVIFTTPGFWFFLLVVGICIYVLRVREPDRPRPFRVPGFPATTELFCAACLFMLYSSLEYAYVNRSFEAYWALGILALGLPLSLLSRPQVSPAADSE